jgi:hypothetical protein
LQILEDSRKYWLYQYCRYWKILENTGYTSIADTGRFWKILVIPILCRGPDETHTVDTVENRVICQDWFVITK